MHLRKRKADHYEPFPARKAWLRLLDRVVITVGIIGPMASLPQIFKIYLLQNVGGISTTSYALWALMDIPWIFYGIVHRERPIVFTYFAWFAVNCIILAGSILYGGGGL